MPLATFSALVFCAAVATVPFKVTTSLVTSTLIVESRRSVAAANAALVLNQIQLSFMPWPIVLEPLSFSHWALFFSYSSLVSFEQSIGVGVAALAVFVFELLLFLVFEL